jgi:predicted  nucleic acid-binding Zn-ribbon protein
MNSQYLTYFFTLTTVLAGVIITIISSYIKRLIGELDETKKEFEHFKFKGTEEVSNVKSRVKVVENQLSNDVINLGKQIEALQGAIRHLESTITANNQAMYTLFMDIKNDKK